MISPACDSEEFSRRRLQRKVARAAYFSGKAKRPALSLSTNGDTVLFDGKTYSVFFAHGGLQIDKKLKTDLRVKKYTVDERREVFETIKKLVAESPYSGNIMGADDNHKDQSKVGEN